MKENILKSILIILLGIGVCLIYKGFEIEKNNRDLLLSLDKKIIKNTKIVNSGNGLYKNMDTYYFRGEVNNNYIKIFNRLYRVLSITKGEVKVVSNNNEAVFFLGNTNSYKESNINYFLNKSSQDKTGIYYDSIGNNLKLLRKITDSNDYFTILSKEEYDLAGDKNSFLNNGASSFLLDKDKVLIKEKSGIVNKSNTETSSGVRASFTLKKKIAFKKGNGTLKDPYVIDYIDNDINKYVKLGEDLYSIIESTDNIWVLKNTKSLKEKMNFSNKYSFFNPINKNNIAYFLNNDYLDELSYKDLLVDCTFSTGEIVSKSFLDNYNSISTAKVGLINMFDLNLDNSISDYYLINTSSKDSNIAYFYNKFGSINEDVVTTLGKIVPVVCFDKGFIKRGSGTFENPFVYQ